MRFSSLFRPFHRGLFCYLTISAIIRSRPSRVRRYGKLNSNTFLHLWIPIFKPPFSMPERYRRTGGYQFLLCLTKNLVPVGSAGWRSGGARKVLYGAAPSNSERAAPSACVGKRFSAPQIVWNRSTRCAGERGGARVGRPRWLRILTIFTTTSHLVRCDRTTTRS